MENINESYLTRMAFHIAKRIHNRNKISTADQRRQVSAHQKQTLANQKQAAVDQKRTHRVNQIKNVMKGGSVPHVASRKNPWGEKPNQEYDPNTIRIAPNEPKKHEFRSTSDSIKPKPKVKPTTSKIEKPKTEKPKLKASQKTSSPTFQSSVFSKNWYKKENVNEIVTQHGWHFLAKKILKHRKLMPKIENVEIQEKSPPGWKGTVDHMKKHKEITNPWALAWWEKNQGYTSHK